MKKNPIIVKFRNVEKRILFLQAQRALASTKDEERIQKKLEVALQKKKDLLLHLRTLLFSTTSKGLIDFLSLTKPTVYYAADNKINDSKNEYIWQFIVTRIEECYLGRPSELVLIESDGKKLMNQKLYPLLKNILIKKLGISWTERSCFSREGGFAIYSVFVFNQA